MYYMLKSVKAVVVVFKMILKFILLRGKNYTLINAVYGVVAWGTERQNKTKQKNPTTITPGKIYWNIENTCTFQGPYISHLKQST